MITVKISGPGGANCKTNLTIFIGDFAAGFTFAQRKKKQMPD